MLTGIIALSTLVGLLGRPRVRIRSGWGHPGAWLIGVTAVFFVNQVLFTIYVLRVHGGDVTFISRYLPTGWFALADHDPAIRWLADHFPAPELLSVSVLRVQSFFELPFVVLALLTVCRWYGSELYTRVAGMIWPIAVSYTATFCLIEFSLRNPYTWDDVIIRVVSAVVVALLLPRLSGPVDVRVEGVRDLVLFLLSVGAVGFLVLAVYDTALLYNLGHVHTVLPLVLLAAVVLVGVRLAARQQGADTGAETGPETGPGTLTLVRAVGWVLAYFAVPALAIRYGLNFGVPRVSAGAGLVVLVAAGFRIFGEIRVARRGVWLAQLAGAVAAGIVAAYIGYRVVGWYPELRLLVAVAAFCAVAVTVCAVVDRTYWRPVLTPR